MRNRVFCVYDIVSIFSIVPGIHVVREYPMSQRLIEIVLPEGRGDDIAELLLEQNFDYYWRNTINDNQARIRIILESSEVETVFDILEPYLENLPDATAFLLNIEAIIPRKTQENTVTIENEEDEEENSNKPGRISRHELYDDIAVNTNITLTYMTMVILSAIIAAIGLVRNDMAIIIGAMVLAPLLIPNVAFALANTLGDTELAAKGAKTAGLGFLLACIMGILIGLVFTVDPATPSILSRTQLHWSDLVLALASGAAGVLAFTSGGQLSLIGVMVAVALMPPLVTAGLLFGSGMFQLGMKALELALANVICVNLSGIVTFSLQGIRPGTWWEKSKASRARKRALFVWVTFLAMLAYMLSR